MVVALWVFAAATQRVEYIEDEGSNLARARYFGYLFLERDVTRPEWGDRHETHTQTMLTHYVLGAWMWVRGHDVLTMPRWSFDASKSIEENVRAGGAPDAATVAEARVPSVVFAASSAVVLYGLGRLLGGIVAGVVAATLAVASPLAQGYLVRAVGDAPLLLLMLLSLLLAVVGLRAGRGGALPLRWAVALGVTLGLALQAKLTASLSLTTIAAWAALVVVATWHGADDRGVRVGRAWRAARGWALALTLAVGVFILTNPHLYPNPLLHTGHLFAQRSYEMGNQALTSARAVRAPSARPLIVLDRSLVSGTWGGARGAPFEALLAVVGAAVLVRRSVSRHQEFGTLLPLEGLILLSAAVLFVGVSANLQVAYPRYFLPTLFVSMLLAGVGASAVIHQLAARVASLRSRPA